MNYQNPYMPYRPQNGINWVQGVEGAKAFQLMPNSNIVLMDSEIENQFYIKVSDNVGMCTLRTFKYEEVKESEPKSSEFVTREEFSSAINELKEMLSNGKQSVQSVE